MRRSCHGFVPAAALAIVALSAAFPPATTQAQSPAAGKAAGAPAVERIDPPSGRGAMAPQITTANGRTILSWIERSLTEGGASTLRFAERTAAGWSRATIAMSSRSLMVNAADVPVVLALAPRRLAAAWPEEGGSIDPEAYNLKVAVSSDNGQTWSPPVTPHRDKTESQHGFAAMLPAADGSFTVLWLDGRNTVAETPEGVGDMALRAVKFGADGRAGAEAVVDARVCECCPLAVAVTGEGPIVAFRDRSPREVRDIAVSRLAPSGWSRPATVHADNWCIEACPVNGPAIAASGKDVAVAWFTGAGNKGQAFAAFSADGGRTFAQPVRIDDEATVGHVSVALLADGSAVASWIESSGGRSTLKVRKVARAGQRDASTIVADAGRTQYPRLARAGDEVIVAWTDNTAGSTALRAARLAIK